MTQPIVKVFSATMARDREVLGEVVTEWLRSHPQVEVDEIRTMQSSDQAYHCTTIVVLGRVGMAEDAPVKMPVPSPGARR